MNLTQFALMTHRTTGLGAAAAGYFRRRARTGDDRPAGRREVERVLAFCARVQKATPEVLPGEQGEGNDLWCEANDLAIALRGHIAALDADPDAPVPEADGCPGCGERDPDRLVWGAAEGEDPETVRCASCGIVYAPPGPPRCPKCGAAQTGGPVTDPDGRVVCGECGTAFGDGR